MKALNNYVSAAGLVAAAEAILVGRRFGLDPATIVDVLNASTGRNNSTEKKMKQQVLSGDFASGFSLALMTKDLHTAAEIARHAGIAAPLSEVCEDLWAEADAKLGAGRRHDRGGNAAALRGLRPALCDRRAPAAGEFHLARSA
jgi:3-hydroxyisobutyrate dehydrogenase